MSTGEFLAQICLEHTKRIIIDRRYATNHFFPRYNRTTSKLALNCEYCGIIVEHAKDIIAHNNEKHTKKAKKEVTSRSRLYLCDVCGKSYTQSSHLWQHLRFHQGEFSVSVASLNKVAIY